MFKWFRQCRTAEEGKDLYRRLAKQYHPDNGGSGNELKEIIVEFKLWWKRYKDVHKSSTGETYRAEQETTETAEEFIEIIERLSNVPNIEIEICGSWLWLTGNTYEHREYLKECGCRWSKGKRKWYWTADPWKFSPIHKSMTQIRREYGSKHVRLHGRPLLDE